jgi:hypothetical protein
MSQQLNTMITVIGIDIGKNSCQLLVSITRTQSHCGRSGHVAATGFTLILDRIKLPSLAWKHHVMVQAGRLCKFTWRTSG